LNFELYSSAFEQPTQVTLKVHFTAIHRFHTSSISTERYYETWHWTISRL